MLRYIRHNSGLNVIVSGQSRLVPNDHKNFEAILKALEAGEEVVHLIDELKRKIADFDGVDFQIVGGELLFRGKIYENKQLTDCIFSMIEKGYHPAPLIRFMEKLEMNPHPQSVEGLWKWIERAGLSLAEDGDFLGFKYVTKVDDSLTELFAKGAQYTDSQTKTFDYTPGKIAEMPRHEVTFDPSVHCSHGLHVGSFNYVKGHDPILMVKVNPADVVSVPNDANGEKLRCCRFQALEIFKPDYVNESQTGYNNPVFSVTGDKVTPSDFRRDNIQRYSEAKPVVGECDNPSASHWDM